MASQLLDGDLAAAYDYCRDLTRREAKNFYYGFISLPPEKRRAIYAAYAFSRECDEDSDTESSDQTKREAIERTRVRLKQCYAGESGDYVLRALNDAVTRYAIPKKYFEELIAGVEMDIDTTRYATFDALRQYCYRVASTVGLISLQIFGYSDPKAQTYAVDLGLALQLTNIIRDVSEDAGRGRIYIPLDELQQHGYSEAELIAHVYNEPFQRLMAAQTQRARQFFGSGQRLLPLLDIRSRACTATMGGIYFELLQRIEAAHYAIFEQRVSLTSTEKLGLIGKMWIACLRQELGQRRAPKDGASTG